MKYSICETKFCGNYSAGFSDYCLECSTTEFSPVCEKVTGSQTKKQSLLEQVVNVVVGMIIGLSSQVAFFYYYEIPISLTDNVALVVWLTIVSVLRGYTLRRFFNSYTPKGNK